MKKFLVLFIALMMCFSAACAEGYTGEAPVCEEKTTLTMLTTDVQYEWMDSVYIHQLLEKANIDLQVELVPGGAYNDVLKPRLAAGIDLPDIVYVGLDVQQQYADLWYDLTDFYNEIGYNIKAWAERFPQNFATLEGQLKNSEGKILYLPHLYIDGSNYRHLIMNTTWLEKAGISRDELTLENLDKFFHYVLENDMNGNGDTQDEVPLFSRADHIYGWGLMWNLDLYGKWQINEDGTISCAYTDPRYKEFLTQMNKWYEEGILYNEYMTSNFDVQSNIMSNDRMACQIHWGGNLNAYNVLMNPEWTYGDTPIFEGVEMVPVYGKASAYGRPNTGGAGGFAINAACDPEKAKLAFAFLDYCYSMDAVRTWWAGNEGEDWVRNADGTITMSDAWLANADAYRHRKGNNSFSLPVVEISLRYLEDVVGYREVMDDYADAHDPEHTMYPLNSYFTTPEQAEVLSMYSTDLDTYFAENMTAFITGTRDIEEFDQYVETAKSMGLEEVLAVYQAQYSAN